MSDVQRAAVDRAIRHGWYILGAPHWGNVIVLVYRGRLGQPAVRIDSSGRVTMAD